MTLTENPLFNTLIISKEADDSRRIKTAISPKDNNKNLASSHVISKDNIDLATKVPNEWRRRTGQKLTVNKKRIIGM